VTLQEGFQEKNRWIDALSKYDAPWPPRQAQAVHLTLERSYFSTKVSGDEHLTDNDVFRVRMFVSLEYLAEVYD